MKSPSCSIVLSLTIVICLGLTGCGSGNSMNAGAKSKESSNEAAPGPQTEPPLTDPKDSANTVEKSSSTDASIVLQAVNRAGFDAVLAKHKGEVVLVDYWATWCAPCRKKFPHTVALAKEHKANGLAVIAISLDDEDAHADVLRFLIAQEATFDNLRSQQGASDESFEAFEIPNGALPCLRLYDRAGQVVKTFAIDPDADKQFTDEDIAEAVKAALAK